MDEDSSASAIHGDIADAVGQLGEKLDLAKAAVSRREISKSEKLTELEERLAQQTADAEEAKALRVTLEKRLEVMKASAKTARESSAAMTVEIEALNAKVKELKDELGSANSRAVSSTEAVSSEVQVLEEENLELLKENKELRMEVSRLKSSATSSSSSSSIANAHTVGAATPMFSPPRVIPTPSAASGALSGHKRAFGTDISNTAPNSTVKPAAQGEVVKTTAGVAPADSQGDAAGKAKSRRGRRKVEGASQPEGNPEECAQS